MLLWLQVVHSRSEMSSAALAYGCFLEPCLLLSLLLPGIQIQLWHPRQEGWRRLGLGTQIDLQAQCHKPWAAVRSKRFGTEVLPA